MCQTLGRFSLVLMSQLAFLLYMIEISSLGLFAHLFTQVLLFSCSVRCFSKAQLSNLSHIKAELSALIVWLAFFEKDSNFKYLQPHLLKHLTMVPFKFVI